MEPLVITAKIDSPAINFDANSNILTISGESRPENPVKFYGPVISWLVNYEKLLYSRKNEANYTTTEITIRFNLGYFNSISAKYIMDILVFMKKLLDDGYRITIEWYYKNNEDDILDAGKEFSSFVDVDFVYKEL